MSELFSFDVFLSYSSKDKPAVLALAERLRSDGLRVWLDDWEIRYGDNILARVEDGLERSRVLVLCMSANGFGSDWAGFETASVRFGDPLNRERRFLPLRLDNTPAKGSLASFASVDWRDGAREESYGKLLLACRGEQATAVDARAGELLYLKRLIEEVEAKAWKSGA